MSEQHVKHGFELYLLGTQLEFSNRETYSIWKDGSNQKWTIIYQIGRSSAKKWRKFFFEET